MLLILISVVFVLLIIFALLFVLFVLKSPQKQESNGLIYRIVVERFFDSNGDGIGDLKGIKAKLQYLKDLGTSIILLNPVQPSSTGSFGYLPTKYKSINSELGTEVDFRELLEAAHSDGMKVVVEFNPNAAAQSLEIEGAREIFSFTEQVPLEEVEFLNLYISTKILQISFQLSIVLWYYLSYRQCNICL